MHIQVSPSNVDPGEIYSLVHTAFASMDGRIDPPSSIHRLGVEDFAAKIVDEILITASGDDAVIGCVFCRSQSGWFYIGKLAVAAQMRRKGIARMLIGQAGDVARDLGLRGLELETRVELTENHATFAAMGFVTVAETAHDGYSQSTSLTMRAELADLQV